jgi:peptide-methionine (S)-S-oxide reductase
MPMIRDTSARRLRLLLAATFGAAAFAAITLPLLPARADDAARRLPPPALDISTHTPGLQTAVFAGGCFWGVQGVFEHVQGVTRAVSGYTGGTVAEPDYETVSSGSTGHAESVRVTYDPSIVSYGKLLQIFFSVALDPTDQARVARAYIAQLAAAHAFGRPIATRIDPAGPFYPAEQYHQDYLELHPDAMYIAINDMPKVRNLQTLFPESWRPVPATVGRLGASR